MLPKRLASHDVVVIHTCLGDWAQYTFFTWCNEGVVSLFLEWCVLLNLLVLLVLLPVELVHNAVHYGRQDEAYYDQEYQACIQRINTGK